MTMKTIDVRYATLVYIGRLASKKEQKTSDVCAEAERQMRLRQAREGMTRLAWALDGASAPMKREILEDVLATLQDALGQIEQEMNQEG